MKRVVAAIAVVCVGVVVIVTMGRMKPMTYINIEDRINQALGGS